MTRRVLDQLAERREVGVRTAEVPQVDGDLKGPEGGGWAAFFFDRGGAGTGGGDATAAAAAARFAFAFVRAPPSGFVGFDGFEAEEEGVRFSDDGASIRREAAAAEPGA